MRVLFDMTALTLVLHRDSVRSPLKSVTALITTINSIVFSYFSAV